MAVENLCRNPQTLLTGLYTDASRVRGLVLDYQARMESRGIPSPSEAGRELRMDALVAARHGLLQPPPTSSDQFHIYRYISDIFAAGDQLNLPETTLSQMERLDYASYASLSGAVRLLNHLTDPKSTTDDYLYGMPAGWAENAQHLTRLHFDGFSYDEIERHYFPKPIEDRAPKDTPVPAQERNGMFYCRLEDFSNATNGNDADMLRDMRHYEYETGQALSPEMRTSFFMLHYTARAMHDLHSTFLNEQYQGLRQKGGGKVEIPHDERGEAYELLDHARNFLLAKIELMAEEQMGIDLSKWFTP